jgi:SAM-dependent methyltransferase
VAGGGSEGSDGARYQERFDAMAAAGQHVHGEADRCSALVPPGARVLDAGCGTGRVAVELDRRGYTVVGVDVDAGMLAHARDAAPHLPWVRADLAALDAAALDVVAAGLGEPFDLVVAAGNVVPLVAHGTEAEVVARLAALLGPGAALVAGFGLDADHLPLDAAPFGLAEYDTWCTAAGLVLAERYATWDGAPYAGGGYAVSVHRRA